jgi:hypothetical protein
MINNPHIAKLLVEARADDLRRDLGGGAQARAAVDRARRRFKRAGEPREAHPAARPGRVLVPGGDPGA